MLRTANDQATLWELILPAELLVLPPEPLGVDALPHDAVFFALFAPYFDARMGRPRGDPSAVLTVLTDRTASGATTRSATRHQAGHRGMMSGPGRRGPDCGRSAG